MTTPSQTPPSITIKGSNATDTTFCSGGMVVLKSDQPTGNMWSTGATSDSIIVNSSGNYSLMFDDGTGCGLQQSNTITVTVNPLPTPSISGTLGICPGGGNMTTLDAGAGYVSYEWSNFSTTQTIDVSVAGSFSVTVIDANMCQGTSPDVNTFFSTPPSPAISGNLDFCNGDSTELDAGTFSSYLWSTGATTQKIFAKTAEAFSVTVTDGSGCIGTSPNVTTKFYATSLPGISGLGGFCPGGSTTLTASNGFNSYSWSTGSSNQSITVSTVGNYSVTVTDNNGCKTSRTKSMIEFANPEPFIAGALSFCGGSSVQIKAEDVNSVGFISYAWSTGATSKGIFVETPGNYSVTVTDIHGCQGDTSEMVVEDGSVPDSPGAISGPDFVPGDSSLLIYSIAPVSNTLFYYWLFPEGVTIVGQEDASAVVVRIDSIPVGEMSVAAANGCGLSPTLNGTIMNFELPIRGDCNKAEFVIDNSPISSGIYQGNTLSSAGTVPVNALVIFKAQSAANLNANFNVGLGAVFEIEITDCN
ncbi:MAG: hypothetical protein HKN76_03390 [Saprospiraceae bacterium]|nr:hypothetical protein [Saprospiraceae bacterium]